MQVHFPPKFINDIDKTIIFVSYIARDTSNRLQPFERKVRVQVSSPDDR